MEERNQQGEADGKEDEIEVPIEQHNVSLNTEIRAALNARVSQISTHHLSFNDGTPAGSNANWKRRYHSIQDCICSMIENYVLLKFYNGQEENQELEDKPILRLWVTFTDSHEKYEVIFIRVLDRAKEPIKTSGVLFIQDYHYAVHRERIFQDQNLWKQHELRELRKWDIDRYVLRLLKGEYCGQSYENGDSPRTIKTGCCSKISVISIYDKRDAIHYDGPHKPLRIEGNRNSISRPLEVKAVRPPEEPKPGHAKKSSTRIALVDDAFGRSSQSHLVSTTGGSVQSFKKPQRERTIILDESMFHPPAGSSAKSIRPATNPKGEQEEENTTLENADEKDLYGEKD